MRNVSMIHRSKYFICNVSWNVTGLSESPNIVYNSSTTFCYNTGGAREKKLYKKKKKDEFKNVISILLSSAITWTSG